MTALRRRFSFRRSETGAVAIVVAVCMTALLIGSAMVLDFGLVRVDRQVNKSAADSATTAGLHGMLSSDNTSYTFRGVCSAVEWLAANDRRFQAVTPATGTWTRGNGTAAANGCTDTTIRNVKCTVGDRSTWARFTWDGTYQGKQLKVTVSGGYRLDDAAVAAEYSEEDLDPVWSDRDDGAEGCYQLAVVITQARKPGLGSLATDADLVTTVRSVGRVRQGPGGDAPAMLLLKRTGCPILETGSNSGGSFIHVYGAVASDGKKSGGTIHADTDGSACTGGSNQNIFLGRASNGIVAYAAPVALNSSVADPSKPGVLSSYAGSLGITGGKIRDSLANAHGATGVNESSPGTATEAVGRDRVTRKLVDERYLGLGPATFGVKQAVATAESTFAAINTAAAAAAAGWKVIPNCNPTAAQLTALNITITSSVYVDCTANGGYQGTRAINGGTVLFAGSIKPPSTAGTSVSLPYATKVYVVGAAGSDAISIGNNSALKVHTDGNTDVAGKCSTNVSPNNKAVMVIKAGQFKQTGGSLQLCRTTVITMGNRADACLPTTLGSAPNSTPCGGATGDSQISLTGNDLTTIDWVAPNTMDITTDASGTPLPDAVTAWHDPNGPEDLALWTESYGGTSNPTYSMGGGGVMHTVGVFMAPNAAPFTISGGSSQDLTNAQYIATSIGLNGTNTNIKMRVDPYSAVTIPKLVLVGLVR